MSPVLVSAVGVVFSILYLLLLARVLCNWFPRYKKSRVVDLICFLTDPFLDPVRSFLRRFQSEGSMFAMIDFSPLVVLLILQAIHRIIFNVVI